MNPRSGIQRCPRPVKTDRCAGGPVQVAEAGQTTAGEHPRRWWNEHAQTSGHQMRAFPFSDPVGHDLPLHLDGNPTRTVVRPKRTILQSGFPLKTSPPSIGGLQRHSHRFSGVGYRPTQLEDPIHQQLAPERLSTFPYSIPLRAPCDTRITTPINQTRRPSLIQAFCQPRPWEVQLADSQGGSDRQSKRFLRQNLYTFG